MAKPKTSGTKPAPKARAASATPRAEAPKRTLKAPARKSEPAKAAAPAKKPSPAPPRKAPAAKTPVPIAKAALTEEERIEEAKYLPRDLTKRLFEEERFVFPESYGVTRVRLLVKDPEWLFAHWDVDPKTLTTLKAEVGERAMALSRLTLRIADPEQGGQKTILLPPGARSWYVRADGRRARAYLAELGVTLPSGEFRRLAESNQVATPRVGPSPEIARERKRVGRVAQPEPTGGDAPAGAPGTARKSRAAKSEPWRPRPEQLDATQSGRSGSQSEDQASEATARGGASDAFRPAGASDVHRR